MSEARNRMDEAEVILGNDLFKKAIADLNQRYVDELLSPPPANVTDHDRWRRERIEAVNFLRLIPHHIKTAMVEAKAEMRKPGSVA